MKKQLLLFVLMMLPLVASADAVEIDGIWYNLISKGNVAEVTKNPSKYTGNISIPENIIYDNVVYNVTSIGEYAFSYCTDLTSVTIPNNITFIGSYAFSGCIALTSVTIPNSVTAISSCMFRNCTGLTSFDIPNNITTIGGNSFEGCTGLTNISIPNSVTVIGSNAFKNCTNLASITIGNGIKSMGSVFINCSSLTDVTCYANKVPTTSAGAFNGSYIEYATLHVPSASVNAYKAKEPWNGFKDIIALAESDPKPTGINVVTTSTNKDFIYDLSGQQLQSPRKGLNIVKMSDGTVKKVIK